ncbi:4'-phosphopantetheinyl transferase superfamily [Mrakia frigida]|uniref:4'-phosphopantetheinyl transferase family protein n=1 Tax=Mrakia frigida TaxID=29902 RepID=UPI003FCC1727
MSVVAVNLSAFSPSEEEFDSYLSLLDDTSQTRIRRFKRRKDALRCLVGRLLPLYLLSTLTEYVEASTITFQTGSHGRPSFASPVLDSPLDYNVSHDGDWVVMAWTRGSNSAVGVDVMRLGLPEGMKDANELVEALEDQLSPSERRALASSSPQDRTTLLLRLWMYKESIAKLLGTGSAEDFSIFSFDLPPFPLNRTNELVKLPAVLSTGERGDGQILRQIRFWEGRLVCGNGVEDEYGVTLATRGVEGEGGGALQVVEVASVVEGARLARAGSA